MAVSLPAAEPAGADDVELLQPVAPAPAGETDVPASLSKAILAPVVCARPAVGRPVFRDDGARLGTLHGLVSLTEGQGTEGQGGEPAVESFFILHLGSIARVGDDARLVPCRCFAEGDGVLKLALPEEQVRGAPIYVEGRRCDCVQWLQKVRSYFSTAPG